MIITHLKKIRNEMHITQRQLEELSGVSQSTISDIECGKHLPDLETAFLLCIAMGRNIKDLFEHRKE